MSFLLYNKKLSNVFIKKYMKFEYMILCMKVIHNLDADPFGRVDCEFRCLSENSYEGQKHT